MVRRCDANANHCHDDVTVDGGAPPTVSLIWSELNTLSSQATQAAVNITDIGAAAGATVGTAALPGGVTIAGGFIGYGVGGGTGGAIGYQGGGALGGLAASVICNGNASAGGGSGGGATKQTPKSNPEKFKSIRGTSAKVDTETGEGWVKDPSQHGG